MRFFSLAIGLFALINTATWGTDFEAAKKTAEKEHKLILLNFSGSDWCIPCIKLHKTIFESSSFIQYSDSNLVLVNADFPRLKKNELSKEQQKKNDKLAEKYNPDGIFPFTLLLDEKGKIIKSWEGMPGSTPEQFTQLLNSFVNASR